MKSVTEPPARERILLTAHDLFYRDGIRATGVDRIIADSGVTKVTFYRHYPSKNDLIRAFLEYRHQRWLIWFKDALERHGKDVHALVPTLAEWFESDDFRGCAFINTVGELANDLPEVVDIACRHKEDMIAAISDLLPASVGVEELSRTLALAIDGAIVRAQYDSTPANALRAVALIIAALIP
ncbi:MAG: TetR/AcrR family transcriptional regulator [Betaproteobacteria bacterium]|nr:TetR/AcrR family transcriptional regulator [Betaproteobacteria bacterium]